MENGQLLEACDRKLGISSIYALATKTSISRGMLYRVNRGEVSFTMTMAQKFSKETGMNFHIIDGEIIVD